jgi:ubiquinone biosynthesis protein
LETLYPRTPAAPLISQIQTALPHAKGTYRIEFSDCALAEGSVAIVVPFTWKDDDAIEREGVFKILKPGIVERVVEDCDALRCALQSLESSAHKYALPISTIRDAVTQAIEILESEIDPAGEQRHLCQAAAQMNRQAGVIVPALLPMCTPGITAMQRLRGKPMTGASDDPAARRRIAASAVRGLLAAAISCPEESAIFHGDPHAGNLLALDDNRVAAIDWSLAGQLTRSQREALTQIVVGGASDDARRIARGIKSLAIGTVDDDALSALVRRSLQAVRGFMPDMNWLIRLLDHAAQQGVSFDRNLLLLRKAFFTLEGVVSDVDQRVSVSHILSTQTIEDLISAWPGYFLTDPQWRDSATHVSMMDLLDITISLPLRWLRWWRSQAQNG